MGAAKRPASFRADPKPRAIDGVMDQTDVVNRDPSRHYVLVNETNHGVFDVDYYLAIAEGLEVPDDEGYRVETFKGREHPRLRIGLTSRKEGDTIRFRGMVLMSCPMDFKKLIDEIGIDRRGGQQAADRDDEQVQNQRGVAADVSGVSVRTRNGTRYIRPMDERELENG